MFLLLNVSAICVNQDRECNLCESLLDRCFMLLNVSAMFFDVNH